MILILTSEAGDYSHLKIVDWLSFKKCNYIILSGESLISGKQKLDIINGEIFLNGVNLTQEVSCVFYRRWFSKANRVNSRDTVLNQYLNYNLHAEIYEIRNFLYTNLINAKWFPDPYKVSVNKIENLEIAKSVGMNVPEYTITNSKRTLQDFYLKCNKQLITKAIGNFRDTFTSDNLLVNAIYTKKIGIENIEAVPPTFVPSLFQKLIDKRYEYRILYFNGKCFASLILSQVKDSTALDSRIKTDGEAKLLPVKLPESLSEKIDDFMKNAGLNIGCIDILYGSDDKYYFLEVNPVGQFGGYSQRCLLNFELEIVNHLININNEKGSIKAVN